MIYSESLGGDVNSYFPAEETEAPVVNQSVA